MTEGALLRASTLTEKALTMAQGLVYQAATDRDSGRVLKPEVWSLYLDLRGLLEQVRQGQNLKGVRMSAAPVTSAPDQLTLRALRNGAHFLRLHSEDHDGSPVPAYAEQAAALNRLRAELEP